MYIYTLLILFSANSLSGMTVKELFSADENENDNEELQIVSRDLLKPHNLKDLRNLLNSNNFDPDICFVEVKAKNHKQEDRSTLFEAFELESFETMKLLLRKKANPNVVNSYGDSILHVILKSLADEYSSTKSMKNSMQYDAQTSAQYAQINGLSKHVHIQNLVIQSLEEVSRQREAKLLSLIKTFLKNGVNTLQKNSNGITVRDYAEQNNLDKVLKLMHQVSLEKQKDDIS